MARRSGARLGGPVMRVVAYVRVSIEGPLDDVLSAEAQERSIARWAASLHHRVVATASDEGETATALEQRVGLARALELVREKQADGIAVARLDRLDRDLVRQEQILADLRRMGGDLFVAARAEQRELSGDATDPERLLVRRVLNSAEGFSRAMRELRVRYRVAKSPLSGDREQASLARIEELSDIGVPLRDIPAILSAEGFPLRLNYRFSAGRLRRIVGRGRRRNDPAP